MEQNLMSNISNSKDFVKIEANALKIQQKMKEMEIQQIEFQKLLKKLKNEAQVNPNAAQKLKDMCKEYEEKILPYMNHLKEYSDNIKSRSMKRSNENKSKVRKKLNKMSRMI